MPEESIVPSVAKDVKLMEGRVYPGLSRWALNAIPRILQERGRANADTKEEKAM